MIELIFHASIMNLVWISCLDIVSVSMAYQCSSTIKVSLLGHCYNRSP